MHWLVWLLGLGGANTAPYLWWSGIGSNIVLGLLAVLYSRFTCDIPGCHRIGLREQELTGKSFCTRHDRLGRREEEVQEQKAAAGELPDDI